MAVTRTLATLPATGHNDGTHTMNDAIESTTEQTDGQ